MALDEVSVAFPMTSFPKLDVFLITSDDTSAAFPTNPPLPETDFTMLLAVSADL